MDDRENRPSTDWFSYILKLYGKANSQGRIIGRIYKQGHFLDFFLCIVFSTA